MTQPLTVLVLGVGGNVSQSILKALRRSTLTCRVVGACVHPLSMGLYTVDRAFVSPPAHDPAFLDWLIGTCEAEKVDAVLSGVEPVLDALSREAALLKQRTGAMAVVSPPAILAVGSDKLTTCEWLREHGFAYPRFADASNVGDVDRVIASCGFPVVAKPRRGKGSAGVSVVESRQELGAFLGRPDYVIEQRLGDDNSEFTVGCFSDRAGQVRGSIAMRRELLHGTTSRAIVGDFPAIREEAVRIARQLKPIGPCNVQLRLHEGTPTCFEINVRFSGTTSMRARFGFNDVEAALRHYVLDEPAVDLPRVTEGIVVRYWNELYVDAAASAALEATGALDDGRHASEIEDFGPKR